jgi:sodium-dependent dicarboxylate transporter 2/3/5
VGLTLFYFFSSLLLSVMLLLWPKHETAIVIATAVISLGIFAMLFAVPLAAFQEKKVLLTIPDCYSNLPMKGFLFVGVVIILGGLAYYLDLAPILSNWFQTLLPRQLPPYFIFLALALLSSFTTEILSNTVVQMGMFALSLAMVETMPFSLLQAFIIISLSCTSAFMSPIATGVNGLAFGGVRQLSLGKMLALGFFMNILGALIISGWIYNFL